MHAIVRLARLLYGSAGVELGAEMAEGDVWPDPPQPCGIIAGTQSLALTNPTSWLTSLFHMLSGEPQLFCHDAGLEGTGFVVSLQPPNGCCCVVQRLLCMTTGGEGLGHVEVYVCSSDLLVNSNRAGLHLQFPTVPVP